MRYIIDRMTVSWNGTREVVEAEEFRRRVGVRQISQRLKDLAREWMKTHAGQTKKELTRGQAARGRQ